MTKPTTKKLPAPHIGTNVTDDLVGKILNRFRQIQESQTLLPKGEKVLGIFKAGGLTALQAVVITNYRMAGVRQFESYGTIVFINELTEKDTRSITAQAVKGLFNRISYELEIQRNGKKIKYAAVKPTDIDDVIKLIEKIKSSGALIALTEAQKRLAAEEKAERNRIAAEQRRQQAERTAQVRQEQKQAATGTKQLAVNRAGSGQCPKCGSSNLQAVLSTSQKGFNDTNACGGCCLFGPIGILCGLCGSGKSRSQSYRMCLNCGNKF